MTVREAIDRIKATPIMRWEYEIRNDGGEPCELAKALKMAIEALEKMRREEHE